MTAVTAIRRAWLVGVVAACACACDRSPRTTGTTGEAAVAPPPGPGSAAPADEAPPGHKDECPFCYLSATAPDDTRLENCSSLPQDGSYGRGVSAAPPPTLAATGLYCILGKAIIAPGIRPFRPRFHLWSDGGVKSRWIYLPPGAQIDTADPDHWSFPVGTKLWKEFSFAGKRVETRFIARFGPGPEDFVYASYAWNAAGIDAALAPAAGVPEAAPITADPAGPRHDIPSVEDCAQCHGKLREHVLGFSAIQLSHALGGVTLASLAREDLLTVAPPAGGYAVPGDELDQRALGFLHANCGHCHNETGVVRPNPIFLRLLVGNRTVADTDVYRTSVGRPHTWTGLSQDVGIVNRIEPGSAARSELVYRFRLRGAAQMPPIATKVIDELDIADVEAWVDRLATGPAPPID